MPTGLETQLNNRQQEAPPAEPPVPGRRVSPRARWLAAGFAVLVLVALTAVWRTMAARESTDDAEIDGHITPISARVGGTVIEVAVNDNQFVEAGTVLVKIDPRDYQVALDRAQGDLAQAEAEAEAARTRVPITSTSTGSVLSASEAGVENALAGVAAAEREVGVARARLSAARAQLEQARALDTRASRDLERMKQLIGKDEISQQEYDSALEQMELNLTYTVIKAPVSGWVSKKTVQVGQVVSLGQPLLAIVPREDIWVIANFKETQLKNMRPGQRADVSVDALGGRKFHGRVDSIAAATGEKFSILPPENATGNYVKVVQRVPVKIVFDPGQDPEHLLRPGLSAEPTVFTK
ncbi:MAG: HlyD family secretion protein [Acidobacteria bacterium]|nr:MAG: HlyD family secretion protein [Acidobacteriota bacterium]